MRAHLPLAAMSGMEDVSDAFQCLICSPDVRTLLIMGPTGTGKSVAARSICGFAPDKEVIEVPQNVTREQLFGSVDIEMTIREGWKVGSESILGRADGNILIADNVNLLPDDILQPLVNAISDGIVRAEVGGISVDSACDSILICTMDPAEGELSGHMMDRFDMCVTLGSTEDETVRKQIIRTNLRYEADPKGVQSEYADREAAVRERIAKARLPDVEVSDGYIDLISKISSEMFVEGHRGDLSVLNVACALSALNGRKHAGVEELKEAVRLCLQHRRRSPPEVPPEPPPQEQEPPPEEDEQDEPDERDRDEDRQDNEQQQPREAPEPEDGDEGDPGEEPGEDKVFAVGEEFDVRDYIPPESRTNRNRKTGKRDLSRSNDSSGRTIGDRIPLGRVSDVALVATLRAAAPYQTVRDHQDLAVAIKKDDLREKVRVRMKGTRLLFVVDGSGSVGAHERMVSVKGSILSMLNDAYRRRDEVGMVVFRNMKAETVLPMTRSVLTAFKKLKELPTGGRTPLLSGLALGYDILRREAEAGYEPVMVVLTDGRGNVGLEGGKPTPEETEKVCGALRESGIRIIVIDTEVGLLRFGRARALSAQLEGEYLLLEDLNAERLTESIRAAMSVFDRGHRRASALDLSSSDTDPASFIRASHSGRLS
ncbi:MAG: VWA domain-containing protein [Candidatus Methanomethylophilaceae archaeon]|nr:VWA domain-containing protein [Candidatus Methanomethylophilaceae archaeon]